MHVSQVGPFVPLANMSAVHSMLLCRLIQLFQFAMGLLWHQPQREVVKTPELGGKSHYWADL